MKKEIKKHFDNLHDLGCIVTGNSNCVIHHCMSGSMSRIGVSKGLALKTSDWLTIPLAPYFHNGDQGIHIIGVYTWERLYGSQVKHLDYICHKLSINVWEKAGVNRNDIVY